jgi:hypothetical protein
VLKAANRARNGFYMGFLLEVSIKLNKPVFKKNFVKISAKLFGLLFNAKFIKPGNITGIKTICGHQNNCSLTKILIKNERWV